MIVLFPTLILPSLDLSEDLKNDRWPSRRCCTAVLVTNSRSQFKRMNWVMNEQYIEDLYITPILLKGFYPNKNDMVHVGYTMMIYLRWANKVSTRTLRDSESGFRSSAGGDRRKRSSSCAGLCARAAHRKTIAILGSVAWETYTQRWRESHLTMVADRRVQPIGPR